MIIVTRRPVDQKLILGGIDEALLMDLQDGARARIQVYEADIATHNRCEARMCLLHKGEPVLGRSCAESMMFLHGQIALLNAFLFETEQYV